MSWNPLKGLRQAFGGGDAKQDIPECKWIEAADSPWGVRLLDVRPVTHTMLSVSSDPKCAENAISFTNDDGTGFIGQEPQSPRTVTSELAYPIDRALVDGVLFTPREMEHKWALFFHRGEIIVVRSWTRIVFVKARVEQRDGRAHVTQIRGFIEEEAETSDYTIAALDFLIRNHACGFVHPAPIRQELASDAGAAAMRCMNMYGNRCAFATPYQVPWKDPERPLRSYSLLHLAVVWRDSTDIDKQLAAGIPIDVLAGDGLAPLHWALLRPDTEHLSHLIERGSPVDVRSDEGATPLMSATQSSTPDKVRFLLGRGADANAVDARGFSALHRAAEMGKVDVARMLVEAGASPDVEAQGHTPRSLANGQGHAEVLALFA